MSISEAFRKEGEEFTRGFVEGSGSVAVPKKYVLGFYFVDNSPVVLLIEKVSPEWCKGKLNGLGGSIEPNETPKQAMVREFKEESGIGTQERYWHSWLILESETWIMEVFFGEGSLEGIRWRCDEGDLVLRSFLGYEDKVDDTCRGLLTLLWDARKNKYDIYSF